jgi:hypothetical protein
LLGVAGRFEKYDRLWLRYSELHAKISAFDTSFNPNTINGSIWKLDAIFPGKVYKPSKGLFRLVKYKPTETDMPESVVISIAAPKIKEEEYYEPFADWLTNEIEDVTVAIPLGRSKFKDKWGTPDVVGKRESRRSDIIKGTTEIVSAEIKTDTLQLITAFGQACAYKIFSNKVYLVVPSKSSDEDLDRLDSLCQIFGIGLVTFNATVPTFPDFRIMVRAARHEPDLFYTNKYMALIEKELFSYLCLGCLCYSNAFRIQPNLSYGEQRKDACRFAHDVIPNRWLGGFC